jgi:hypothetical protein
VAWRPAKGAGLQPHQLHIAVKVEWIGDAVFWACLPLKLQELRKVLGLTDDRSARIRRSVQLRRDDVEVWRSKAEEGCQLVIASAELCGVFTGPVRYSGANVTHVVRGH